MYLPRFSHFIFFLAVFALTVLAVHWYNGYYSARQKGQDVSYFQYVRQQINATSVDMRQLPGILEESRQSGDDILRGSMIKLSDALEIYNIDTGVYPPDIKELAGDYIKENNALIKRPDFYYRRVRGGYEMGVILPVSGKEYVIRR